MRFAKSVGYANLGTFEFLVDATGDPGSQPFVFIETNARLQVEHTVTEEVTGVDLVQAQILLAQGRTLKELGLGRERPPHGYAIQVRVNMETVNADGSLRPGGGTLSVYEAPSGPGVRTDGFGVCGVSHVGRVRLASGEGDRAFAPAGLCRRGDARRPGIERIPDRRRRHQHSLFCVTFWRTRTLSPAPFTRAGWMSTSANWRVLPITGSALSNQPGRAPRRGLPARG